MMDGQREWEREEEREREVHGACGARYAELPSQKQQQQ